MGTIPGGEDITTYDLGYTGQQVNDALGIVLTTDFEDLTERAEGAAQTATDAATAANGSANAAALSKQDSEAWAVGTINGAPVNPDDPRYHNNSSYYAQQALNRAATATAAADRAEQNGDRAKAYAVGDGFDYTHLIEADGVSDQWTLPDVPTAITAVRLMSVPLAADCWAWSPGSNQINVWADSGHAIIPNHNLIEVDYTVDTSTRNAAYYADSIDPSQLARIDGYYATLGAGVADNLAGRGDGVGAEFTFRTAGGDADIGTGRATMKKISGKSVGFNQMAKAVASVNWSGSNASLSVSAGVGTFTASARGGMAYSVVSPALIVGRKYLISCLIKLTTANAADNVYVQLQNQSPQLHPAAVASWQRVSAVVQITATATNQMQIRDYRTSGWTAISFAQPMCIDLTAMFGAGNEPTADEFLSLYPAYYGVNSGELLNMTAGEIATVGFNLLDVNGRDADDEDNADDANHRGWYDSAYFVGQGYNNNYAADRVASYTVADGVISVTAATNVGGYGIAFPVRVIAGKDYFLQYTQTGSGGVRIYWYGADGIYLGLLQGTFSSYFTAPAGAYWAVIYFTANGNSSASWSGINFNLSWSHWRDGEVEDYWAASAELPTLTYFPDGMRSAGNVADELTATTATQRVMAVDLGDLTWTRTAQGDDFVFVSDAIDGMADTSGVTCAAYVYSSDLLLADKSIRSGAGDYTLVIRDDAYSDAAAFTAALDGVFANVELETQVVTTIPGGLAMVYAVDDFGTEQAAASGLTAPLIGVVAYTMNAVDTLRRMPTTYISKASFDAFCSALAAQLGVTITASWDDDAGHYTYTIG